MASNGVFGKSGCRRPDFLFLFFCYGMFAEEVYVNDVNAIPIG